MSNNIKQVKIEDTGKVEEKLQIEKLNSNKATIAVINVTDEREIRLETINNVNKERLIIRKEQKKKAKQQREIEAVQRLLPAYNQFHTTDYQNPINELSEASPIDVRCNSISGKFPPLTIQITASEKEAFAKLGSERGFERSFTGSTPWFALWRDTISGKSKKYSHKDKKDLILLLDGWPVAYRKDLENFQSVEKEFLHKTGFKEIWFAGESVVIKLL